MDLRTKLLVVMLGTSIIPFASGNAAEPVPLPPVPDDPVSAIGWTQDCSATCLLSSCTATGSDCQCSCSPGGIATCRCYKPVEAVS